MHKHDLGEWSHSHHFNESNPAAEKGTWAVMWITAIMMVIEIGAGWWFNSMALLADGWHMSSHAVAIGLSAFAYSAARRYANDERFAFGTWKIEILGGFASALVLLGVAGLMVFSSVERILWPQSIHYDEAIIVACLGLIVNIICAVILGKAHHHPVHNHANHAAPHAPHGDHQHSHPDKMHHHHHHHDLNLKSAYVHVLADAATSILAIVALMGGKIYGWQWLDPAMGILGAVLMAMWAKNLIHETGNVLLDREMDHPVVDHIRLAVETPPEQGHTQVVDLHVWRVGRHAYACAMTLVTHNAELQPNDIRQQLAVHEEIVHVTVEIHQCAQSEASPALANPA